jgi:hypothetical protein
MAGPSAMAAIGRVLNAGGCGSLTMLDVSYNNMQRDGVLALANGASL